MAYTKEHKVLQAIYCRTIRQLVEEANSLNIQREDIITILKEGEYFCMIYYYGGERETN